MSAQLRELWQAREAVALLVRRELRLRYKNSALGMFWSLINPIVQCLMIWYTVRKVWDLPIQNYSAYLFCAFVPWTFFQLTLLDSCSCIRFAGPILKKIYFPRELLPVVAVGANFVHFLIAFVVFLIYSQVGLRLAHGSAPNIEWRVLWLIPILTMMLLTATGFALVLSCLNVYYEDVKYIVQTSMAVLFFGTPVIYQADSLSDPRYVISQLNPFGVVVTQFQKALLPQQSYAARVLEHPRPLDPSFIAIGLLVSLCIAFVGFRVFDRHKWDLAEKL